MTPAFLKVVCMSGSQIIRQETVLCLESEM